MECCFGEIQTENGSGYIFMLCIDEHHSHPVDGFCNHFFLENNSFDYEGNSIPEYNEENKVETSYTVSLLKNEKGKYTFVINYAFNGPIIYKLGLYGNDILSAILLLLMEKLNVTQIDLDYIRINDLIKNSGKLHMDYRIKLEQTGTLPPGVDKYFKKNIENIKQYSYSESPFKNGVFGKTITRFLINWGGEIVFWKDEHLGGDASRLNVKIKVTRQNSTIMQSDPKAYSALLQLRNEIKQFIRNNSFFSELLFSFSRDLPEDEVTKVNIHNILENIKTLLKEEKAKKSCCWCTPTYIKNTSREYQRLKQQAEKLFKYDEISNNISTVPLFQRENMGQRAKLYKTVMVVPEKE